MTQMLPRYPTRYSFLPRCGSHPCVQHNTPHESLRTANTSNSQSQHPVVLLRALYPYVCGAAYTQCYTSLMPSGHMAKMQWWQKTRVLSWTLPVTAGATGCLPSPALSQECRAQSNTAVRIGQSIGRRSQKLPAKSCETSGLLDVNNALNLKSMLESVFNIHLLY